MPGRAAHKVKRIGPRTYCWFGYRLRGKYAGTLKGSKHSTASVGAGATAMMAFGLIFCSTTSPRHGILGCHFRVSSTRFRREVIRHLWKHRYSCDRAFILGLRRHQGLVDPLGLAIRRRCSAFQSGVTTHGLVGSATSRSFSFSSMC